MLPITREWVAKAESDYDGACEALRSRKKSRRDRICFFSQQCVEKYLKARLTEAGIAFPRTHELARKAGQLRIYSPPSPRFFLLGRPRFRASRQPSFLPVVFSQFSSPNGRLSRIHRSNASSSAAV